jgi:hypothetical protein
MEFSSNGDFSFKSWVAFSIRSPGEKCRLSAETANDSLQRRQSFFGSLKG